jgi:hypothetical protein
MLKESTPLVVVHYAGRSLLKETNLEETINLASLGINIDVEVAWGGGKTRDGLDVGSECISDDLVSKEWRKHDGKTRTYR